MAKRMKKSLYLTTKEIIDLLSCEGDENKPVRFHTSSKFDMTLLSVYPSSNGKYIEVDIGFDTE